MNDKRNLIKLCYKLKSEILGYNQTENRHKISDIYSRIDLI
jgi:hypothetical protein